MQGAGIAQQMSRWPCMPRGSACSPGLRPDRWPFSVHLRSSLCLLSNKTAQDKTNKIKSRCWFRLKIFIHKTWIWTNLLNDFINFIILLNKVIGQPLRLCPSDNILPIYVYLNVNYTWALKICTVVYDHPPSNIHKWCVRFLISN